MNKKHLIKFLADSDDVRNRLGARMFPGVARQGESLPYLTVRQIGTERFNDLAGEDSIASVTYQLTTWAATDTETREIDELIRLRISGYRGLMDSTYVHGCTIENQREQQIKPAEGSDHWLFGKSTDYQITFNQPVPTFA